MSSVAGALGLACGLARGTARGRSTGSDKSQDDRTGGPVGLGLSEWSVGRGGVFSWVCVCVRFGACVCVVFARERKEKEEEKKIEERHGRWRDLLSLA